MFILVWKDVYARGLNEEGLIAKTKGVLEFDSAYADVAQYGCTFFWDDRYLNDTEPFEWYYPYQYFRQSILDNVPLDGKVLIAGCGNLHHIEDMATDGFENLIGVDISRVVIGQMKVRCSDLPMCTFLQRNLTDTDIESESVDAVIDKALLDSIVCSDTGHIHVQQYVDEIERIFTSTGVFIVISRGNPEERLQFLEQYDLELPNYTPWLVEVQGVGKSLHVCPAQRRSFGHKPNNDIFTSEANNS